MDPQFQKEIQQEKALWLERLSFLKPMIETVNDALDTIAKAEKLNGELLLAITGLNELHYTDCLFHLRAIKQPSQGSNAKLIGEVTQKVSVNSNGDLEASVTIPVAPNFNISND
jgi:hypothetical protein